MHLNPLSQYVTGTPFSARDCCTFFFTNQIKLIQIGRRASASMNFKFATNSQMYWALDFNWAILAHEYALF